MKLLKKWLTLLVVIVVFFALIIVSIPVILDSRPIQNLLSGFVSAHIMAGIKPDKVTFALFPFPSIEISGISISKAPLQNITIEEISIYFSQESLAKRKLIINKIVLKKPAIPLTSNLLSIPFKEGDLFDHISQEQGDFSVEIRNMVSDIFKSADMFIKLSPSKRSIAGEIIVENLMLPPVSPFAISYVIPTFKSYSAQHLKANFLFRDTENFDIDLAVSESLIRFTESQQPAIKPIKIDNAICNLVMTKNQFSITMKQIVLEPFVSSLSVEFNHYKERKKKSLLISGTHVNIDVVRSLGLKLMPDNLITRKIFDIVQGGVAKKIDVFFQNNSSLFLAAQTSPGLTSAVSFFSPEDVKELFNPHQMTINAEVENGIVTIPSTHLTAKEISGAVIVAEGSLHAEIIDGNIGISKVGKGILDVDLLHNDHDFKGEFEVTADLAHLNKVLQDLLVRTSLSRELATLREINGKTVGTLKLQRKNRGKLSVFVNTQNIFLSGKYPKLPREFAINGGQFIYRDDMILVDNLKGRVGESSFSNLSASLTLDKNQILNIKSGKSEIVLEQVLPWLAYMEDISVPSFLPIIKNSKGKLYLAETGFKGKLVDSTTWDYLVNGSCNKITLRHKLDKDDISDIKADFLITPLLTRIYLNSARIHDTDILSLFMKHEEAGDVANIMDIIVLSDIRTPFNIANATFRREADKYDINDIKTYLSGRVIFNETLQVYLRGESAYHSRKGSRDSGESLKSTNSIKTDSKAKNENDGTTRYQIKVYDKGVESATVIYDAKREPTVQFTGTLNTAKIAALLNPESEIYHSLTSLTGNKELTIESNKRGYYAIKTKELDLNFILEREKLINQNMERVFLPILSLTGSPLKELPSPTSSPLSSSTSTSSPLNRSSLTTTSSNLAKSSFPIVITLDCGVFTHRKLSITPLSARIELNGQNKEISIEQMRICNIDSSTRIKIKQNLMELFIALKGDNRNIEPVISCLYNGDRLIQGNFSLNASLYSHGRVNREMDSLKKNLTGKIEVTSDGGRIFRLTLLSRILSVINISKLMEGKFPDIEQDGFAFNSINILADVEKGRIILKQAVIHGLDMTLVFVGWLDPFTRDIDLTCLVAPFKTADSIIEKIPIINTMMSGRLISVPVKATGTLNNPDVTVLHPSEVARSILNTMQDILTTPFKLIDLIE
ncbi:MAG: AsmA-like C-terminal domain-containing protein [Desulfamplus sp.]|nr:AsmA-like C-terminal domain-containing protein [Desulfamplus sp.]